MTVGQAHHERAVAEPLGRPPTMRADREWRARVRENTRQIERYSRFVIIMKRALPLAAAALIAAVFVYALQPRQESRERVAMSFQRLGIVNNDLAMMKPKLTGEDDEGDPYVITADQAIQSRQDAKLATLRNIEGDVTLKDGSWIGTFAPDGQLDARSHRLGLKGAIAVYSGSGYEMHTTAADVDMQAATITGKRSVTGQGPFGNFRADGFRVERRTRQVFLYGHVQMIIQTFQKKHV